MVSLEPITIVIGVNFVIIVGLLLIDQMIKFFRN